MGSLDGKVALVTGGSRGIGRAVVKELAGAGASVAINYQGSREAAEEVLREIESFGGKGIVVQADVSDFEACESMVKKTVEELGRIDVLVNNAGINRDNLLARMKQEEWEQVIGINLNGVYNCTRAVIRPLLKQKSGGRIINISSVSGVFGNSGQANYAAAKGGVIAFTKTVAKELGSRGINVNAVAPGMIESEMTEKLSEEIKNESVNRISLGRFGKPEEVAQVVIFLAESGDYITGQVICVDGDINL